MARDDGGNPSPIAWLTELLWPEVLGYRVVVGPTDGRSDAPRLSWIPLPPKGEPTLLVPTSPRAGGASLREYNASMSQLARLRKRMAGAVVSVGAGGLLTRDRVSVRHAGPRSEWPDLIDAVLPRILGVPKVEVSISIGRQLRPNLKPVLRVMDPAGKVLAYAKIGWNDLTRQLVRNEARVLRAWSDHPPRRFQVPRLLHEGDWNGLAITMVSPLPHRVFKEGPKAGSPGADALEEVASLEGSVRTPLGASAYWRSLLDRMDDVLSGERREALRSTMSAIEGRFGDRELRFGGSHGDWTPWNMDRSRGTLLVWDWERYATPRPVGLDALHYWFEVGFLKERPDVASASRDAIARSESVLDGLGSSPGDRAVLQMLALLERLHRVEEGRAANLAVHDELASGILRLLNERVG
jgi:hypothetical protein